ncbi:hypothetical protein PHYSODRAFT_247421 [Phytophthora sojae]|uniref:Transmembrane protein n=1 Tax=Phytophthora sojae (strain P6497) TaxID=1094619 RepID=G4Z6Z4_PHYSP|nr:hypothetical protein PHYSODRAFT_247421 [Phytophthora sojae]EGZ21746.1 hypothetical protein PHYSODRAFT_247421 [Phytophthora sojae]|eukprot:XP_009524463.1 hypothetical protein PHYSODRAFT_247421 [Phytophthora sojae]
MQQQQDKQQELEQRALRPDDAPQEPTPVVEEEPKSAVAAPACAQDVAAFCQKEANIAALLREAPDVVEPRKIVEAVRKVRVCMLSHADVLSVDCVNTLSVDVLGAAPTMAASVPAKKVAELDNADGTGGPSSAISEVLAHPVTWVFVLPFFVIGMYVSVTRIATFLRRRREERRIESKQYMPVN